MLYTNTHPGQTSVPVQNFCRIRSVVLDEDKQIDRQTDRQTACLIFPTTTWEIKIARNDMTMTVITPKTL